MILWDALILLDFDFIDWLLILGLLIGFLLLNARVNMVLFLFLVIVLVHLLANRLFVIITFILDLDIFCLVFVVFFVQILFNFGALLSRLTTQLTVVGAQTYTNTL